MKDLGCYKECTNCKNSPICCENFSNIDAPVINEEELKNIESNRKFSDFYKKQRKFLQIKNR